MRSKTSKIGALLVSHWANDGYSVILPLLLVAFSLEFNLSSIQAASIISVYTTASAVAQLPVAFFDDYSGKSKQLLSAGLFVFSAALIGYASSPSYMWLLSFAFLGGLGFSSYHPISMNLMTQQFSNRKGFSLGIHTVVGSIGATMVPIILGFFSGNWRLGVWLLAIPGIISGLWVLLAFESVKTWHHNKSVTIILKKTLTNPLLLLATTFGGISQMVYWGSVTFIPLYFTHYYNWTFEATGILLGAFHFTAIISQPLLGYLSDVMSRQLSCQGSTIRRMKMIKSYFRDRNLLLFLLGLVIVISCSLLSFIENLTSSVIFTLIIGAAVLALRPINNAKVIDIVDSEIRSTAIGLNFTFISGLGAVGPLLGGFIEEIYSYQTAFLVFGLINLLGLAVLFLLNYMEKKQSSVSINK